ncbi:MAG TPA: beta-galactosidase [Verrucomicrobiae bacterium]|nr:beta-galactosidase [Verrucomicrobiae bacterium]
MTKRYPPINPKCPHFLHGGDYNPDQWLRLPAVLNEDRRLMKLAHCNAMTVGVFSWAALEPEEGRFAFDWLDRTMDDLAANRMFAVLATPSGARPAWMSHKYPEVLRVNANRQRILHGGRHNHCYTSTVYREKTALINRRLAERYKNHPALLIWHISNEYSGECHCPLCQEAFRQWLKARYGSLDAVNQAWWTAFWSHTYTDWSQIESPAPHGEGSIHGLNLDWKRFVTRQTVEFMKNEIAPLREITPNVPVTTNMMGTYTGLNYWKLAAELDVVSWDNYPAWHGLDEDWRLGSHVSFVHDIYRCMKGGKPFMLMESTPSVVNWDNVCKPKRPGMHRLSSLQAVAHGADTVQYFQWRKGRGSSEKFHGAVVDHVGHEDTRVFRDVTEVGEVLEKLDAIIGTTVRPEAAIIYDWENEWAIRDLQGLSKNRRDYGGTCVAQYRPFWSRGVPVDVIEMDCELAGYKLVVAPMLYMVRPGVAERIEKFVKQGGTFVATYWSGIVNESDLCFLGGFPGPLRKVLGVWAEEIDVLHDGQTNAVVPAARNGLGLTGRYKARELCDLIHAESAQVLAKYGADFYKGRPALTVNAHGKGRAYYIASRNDGRFHEDFYGGLIRRLDLKRVLQTKLPAGVTAQVRTDGKDDFVFLLNFQPSARRVTLGREGFSDMLTGGKVTGSIALPAFGSAILRRPHAG